MKEFLTFISAKRVDLAMLGILFIEDGTKRGVEAQFSSYLRQFEQMSLEQQQKVMKLRDQFRQQMQQNQAQDDIRAKEEDEKKKKREEEIRKKMEQKVDVSNINWEQPLSKIPDCLEKYLKIIGKAPLRAPPTHRRKSRLIRKSSSAGSSPFLRALPASTDYRAPYPAQKSTRRKTRSTRTPPSPAITRC